MGVAVVLLNKQERRHKVAVVGEWGGSWKSWVRILLKNILHRITKELIKYLFKKEQAVRFSFYHRQ